MSTWCGDDNIQNGKQTQNWSSSSRKAFPFGVWHTYIYMYIYAYTYKSLAWNTTVMVPKTRAPQQRWSWRSRERASGILRVPGCEGLISQLLPYNRIWWRASRARATWARVSLHAVPCSQTGNGAPKSLIPALYPYVKMHLQYVSVKSLISLQMVSSAVYGPCPKAKPLPLYLLLLVINTFRININLSWLLWEPNGKKTDLSAVQM